MRGLFEGVAYFLNIELDNQHRLKQKYAWIPGMYTLGYILVLPNDPLLYIPMEQYVNFRVSTVSHHTRYPYITSINGKMLSLTKVNK